MLFLVAVAACTMLMGVLVVAFPVSVFSDLWQKELRTRGAIITLEEDNDDDDDEHDVAKMPVSVVPDVLPLSPPGRQFSDDATPISMYVKTKRTPMYGQDGFLGASTNSIEVDDDHVVLRKSDLTEIIAHINTVHDSQRQIRAILKKYKLHTSTTN
jgi:hypothetical protein